MVNDGKKDMVNMPFTAFIYLSLILGGAGYYYPIQEALLEILAAAALATTLVRLGWQRVSLPGKLALASCATILALPLLQLVPMADGWWETAPIRSGGAALSDALGMGDVARPISLAPDATWRAALALLVPLAAFIGTFSLSTEARIRILRWVVVAALVGVTIAALQLAGGKGGGGWPYKTSHFGHAAGLFVNRNHQAAFLNVAIVLAAMPGVIMTRTAGASRLPSRWPAALAVVTLFALGVLATASRSGLLALPFALIAASLIGLAHPINPRRFLAMLALLAGLGSALASTSTFEATMERFDRAGTDARLGYWGNTRFAIDQAMPWGTGFGSFPKVYPTVETLDSVTEAVTNRAHNDFLEVALDGGMPAILLAALVAALMAFAVWKATQSGRSHAQKRLAMAGLTGIFILLAASVTDYPLRMSALAALFGLCAGLLLPREPQKSQSLSGKRLRGMVFTLLATLILAVPIARSAWSQHLLFAGQADGAARWAPWSGDAWSALATQRFLADDVEGGDRAARRALAISPIETGAARVAGFAAMARGEDNVGENILLTASSLGWRDGLLQLWAAEQATHGGQSDIAVQRIDALLRMNKPKDALFARLAELMRREQGTDAIAEALRASPPWRASFLRSLAASRTVDGAALVSLANAMAKGDTKLSPAEAAPLLSSLLEKGDRSSVRAIRKATGESALIGNGGFASEESGPVPPGGSPYRWRAPRLFGVYVSIAEPPAPAAGQAAQVISEGSTTGVAIAQSIDLAPGPYRLSLLGRAEKGDLTALKLSIKCIGAPANQRIAAIHWERDARGWRQGFATIVMPDGDCRMREIGFSIDARTETHLWIDNILVEHAG